MDHENCPNANSPSESALIGSNAVSSAMKRRSARILALRIEPLTVVDEQRVSEATGGSPPRQPHRQESKTSSQKRGRGCGEERISGSCRKSKRQRGSNDTDTGTRIEEVRRQPHTTVTPSPAGSHRKSVKSTFRGSIPPSSLMIDLESNSSTCSSLQSRSTNSSVSSRADKTILPEGVVDIDKCRRYKDELHCSAKSLTETYLLQYGKDYFQALFNLEQQPGSFTSITRSSRSNLNMDYIPRQPHLNHGMRKILVDWLIEVAEEYKMQPKTIHLAVKLVDKVLAAVNDKMEAACVVEREMLQCVGCACMLISSKLVDHPTPTPDDYVFISDSSYTRQEITAMEKQISTLLQFNLYHLTPHTFLSRFLAASDQCSSPNLVLETMSKYILELGLLQYELLSEQPSRIAAAAVYLARATLGIRDPNVVSGFWSVTLKHYTNYAAEDIEDVVLMLHKAQTEAEECDLKGAYNKYGGKQHGQVALKTVLRVGSLEL